MIWILVIIFAVAATLHIWKRYNHPARALIRQAVTMKWIPAGRIKSDTGGYDRLLSRGHYKVRLRWRDGIPIMVMPSVQHSFKDFIEIEEWILVKAVLDDADEGCWNESTLLAQYRNQVINSLSRQSEPSGTLLFTVLIAMEGGTHDFRQASFQLIKTGYEMNFSPSRIGMFHVNAVSIGLGKGDDGDACAIDYLRDVCASLMENERSNTAIFQ